jgi:hypothetical protein
MRLRLVALVACVVAAGCGSGKQSLRPATATQPAASVAAAGFRIQLSAPTHTPRAGKAKWWYVVRATDAAGRPVRGRLTVEVVDPLGTAHPAEVGTSHRKLVDYPFSGRYRDFAQWPAAARGYRLVFRVTVVAKGVRRTVRYWVRPR